ncbi:Nn.00g088270.m01.CDS01 [Neocucurbitaria sp. VM-36]
MEEVKAQKSTRSTPIVISQVDAQNIVPRSRPSTSNWADNSPYPEWDIPHLTKTPWELERHKKNSTWRRSKPSYQLPAHIFKILPKEVYDCIVVQLAQIHLGQDQACSSCYLKDLYNLSLTSRMWDKAATAQMYRKIVITTNEEHAKLPKLKIKGTSRLKLLRRTLRERLALSRCVRELHLSDFQTLYESASIESEDIVNLVASLVMACPRLERVVGFHIPFAHSFDRLSHALSTRPNLKERICVLKENDAEFSEEEDEELSVYYHAARDPTERFLELNARHPSLATLVLHQEQDQPHSSLNYRAIVGTFQQLPLLRHLSISGLAATSFTNLTLNALPPNLQSLRLENLPGINDKGLQRATSRLLKSVEKLTLVNLELTSLVTVSYILSAHFETLKDFSLVQYRAPSLSSLATVPDFESRSLRYLHWEIRSQACPVPDLSSSSLPDSPDSLSFPFKNSEPISCLATSLLAASIRDGAFPSLRRVRIPHDPQGIIQCLCRPLTTALLPEDTDLVGEVPRISGSNGVSTTLDSTRAFSLKRHSCSAFVTPSSPRADSAIDSPTSTRSFAQGSLTPLRSRLAAQSRIIAAKKNTYMTVRVYDPERVLRLEKELGGFMGQIGSKITYDLTADRSRSDQDLVGIDDAERNLWITGIEDLVGGTDDADAAHDRFWSECGHLVGGRVNRAVVRTEDIF